MKMKHTALITLVAAVIVSAAWWHQDSQNPVILGIEQPLLRNTQLPITHFKPSPKLGTAGSATENSLAQPVVVSSLVGSLPDGAVNIDEHGNVLIDQDLHRLFDHFLTAVGELGPDEIRQRLLHTASDYLSLDQLEQLRDHFDAYVEYLQAADHLALSFQEHEQASSQLETIKSLRRQYLGEMMADAFFAEEEAYAAYVMSGTLAAVDAPEDMKLKWLQAEDQSTAFHDVLLENHLYNEMALSEADRLQMRTEAYGNEVALKLAALDAQQQKWQAEVDLYLARRAALAGDELSLAVFEAGIEPHKLMRLQAHHRAHSN